MSHGYPLSARRDWNLAPVGPYVVEMLVLGNPYVELPFEPTVCVDIDEAARFFAEHCLPVQTGWVAAFGDIETGSLLAGWVATKEVLANNMGEPRLFGLRAGIEALERTEMVNIVDLAIWESQAKQVALGVDW